MRSMAIGVLLIFAAVLAAGQCRADSALFKSFFEQRETVASVMFEHGSSRLSNQAIEQLEASLDEIRKTTCQSRMIRIEGFSGSEGSADSNFRLSLNRAHSVSKFLKAKGIPCLVGINGYGDLRSGQADANDRRVEIAAYPRMFLFNFDDARTIHEVSQR